LRRSRGLFKQPNRSVERSRTQVHVALSHRQILVSRQFLDRADRSATHCQVWAERATEYVHAFVGALEAWIIDALAHFNVEGELRAGRVGVWVQRRVPGAPPREDKIAAIGVKLRRWVSFHGIALNVEPDLSHFAGIVPCGQTEHGVTSLVDLGRTVALDDVDAALKTSFVALFGPVAEVEAPA